VVQDADAVTPAGWTTVTEGVASSLHSEGTITRSVDPAKRDTRLVKSRVATASRPGFDGTTVHERGPRNEPAEMSVTLKVAVSMVPRDGDCVIIVAELPDTVYAGVVAFVTVNATVLPVLTALLIVVMFSRREPASQLAVRTVKSDGAVASTTGVASKAQPSFGRVIKT